MFYEGIFMDIKLKTRTADHVIVFWNKTRDEEIRKMFPISYDSLEEAISLFEESTKENATSYGKVIYYQGKYVGDIWCYSIDEIDEKMAMLSILIFKKEIWGKGIATEAIRDFCKEIFNKFDIEKIGAFIYSSNYASIGLLQKTRFVEIDTFLEDGIESKYFELRSIL